RLFSSVLSWEINVGAFVSSRFASVLWEELSPSHEHVLVKHSSCPFSGQFVEDLTVGNNGVNSSRLPSCLHAERYFWMRRFVLLFPRMISHDFDGTHHGPVLISDRKEDLMDRRVRKRDNLNKGQSTASLLHLA